MLENKTHLVGTNLSSNNDYQIEYVNIEPDSVYGQDKSYSLGS